MTRRRNPEELAPTVALLRGLRFWSKTQLAEASGVDKSQISRYELGHEAPSSRTLERLAVASGVPPFLIESITAFVRRLRQAMAGQGRPAQDAGPRRAAESPGSTARRVVAESLDRAISQARSELKLLASRREAASGAAGESGHVGVEALWERLRRFSAQERRVLVKGALEYQDPLLAQRLCEESVKAAASDAGVALTLAELALLIAGLVPGASACRSSLQGYAWAFVSNARRVANDMQEAEDAFARVWQLWKEEDLSAYPFVLNKARLFDLEASLRRDQRRFAEALELHDRALAASRPEEVGYRLVNKAKVEEELGDFEGALATLQQAVPLIEEQGEPRLIFVLRFNSAVNLLHLGRMDEAEELLAVAGAAAVSLGNELDLLRVRWLESRVHTGHGRTTEAIVSFDGVRREFAARGMAYDAALATLELASLYLEEERTREVKALAREMAPIFQAQGIHREALAALQLFGDAAEREAISLEMARRLLDYLERARHEPGLRFGM